MTLDTSGALLEGARYGTGNNAYTFPPDSVRVGTLSAAERAEYLVVAGSLDASKHSLEIADPDLVFYWSRNEPGVTRFDYDYFSGRWLPMPGTAPQLVGNLSNEDRLTIPVPDPSRVADAPYDLYIDGSPRASFSLVFIGSAAFSDPSALIPPQVEVNQGGQLNFNSVDAANRAGQPVHFTGQGFAPRLQSKGNIGLLPDFASTDYRIFLNPRPAAGHMPLLRIGYGPYLTPEAVADEGSLSPPAAGRVRWSVDTGRLKFADADIEAHPGETVYCDGAYLGQAALSRASGMHVSAAWPASAFTIADAVDNLEPARFVIFAEKSGEARQYFTVALTSGAPASAPPAGWAYINSATGAVYLAASDVSKFSSWTFGHVDAELQLGIPGAAMLMRRSGVNGSGQASAPDFTVVYEVSQLLTDNLPASPFLMLPTVPLVDSDLQFVVEMGSGKYVGALRDATDPEAPGYGYILDLDTRRLKFSRRASPQGFMLPKEQAFVKLDGAALVEQGVEITRNGVLLTASDFDLDTSAGLIEFVEPVGEGDINSKDVAGQASGSSFAASEASFVLEDKGKRLLVLSGDNAGIRDITAVRSNTDIEVDPPFVSSGSVAASVRATDEIVADRIWAALSSVPKKFSIYRSPSGPAGVFTKVGVSGYQVKANVGQVNLLTAAQPGEAIRIEYVSLDSEDEGVTTTPISRVEMALFKIRQETPTFAVGSKVVTFNAAGKTVNQGRPIVLYIEGVTQDSTAYTFVAPGTLILKDGIPAGPVTIDYWVEEAIGGETTIDLLYSPVDYDNLKVVGPVPGSSGGSEYIDVSGDQTAVLKADGAILAENKDVLYIASSSYDAATDLTRVAFSQPAVDDSEILKAADTIRGAYQVLEANPVEIFVSGTTAVRIHADVQQQYPKGTVIDFDGDPYWVLGAAYDSSSGVTTVSTAGRARRNYITPTVQRTVRPVYDPGSNFATARPAYTSRGFVLAKMGSSPAVLQQGVDYDLGDDGVISLRAQVGFGDILRAMYVARVPQPAGTQFELNFAYEIAPSDSNGLSGQKLRMNYNLYAPDSFFFRIETVVSMLPEAKEAATSTSSASSSGPNIASTPSKQTKNAGLPSPWYDSTHYQNLDVVVQRFLKFYHDLIEKYEDILELIDGRQVGGSSGRFRYDGLLYNTPRLSYSEITNDIDDRVKLYDAISMSPGFPPSVTRTPVYGSMAQPNNLSRLFPMVLTGASFIDDTSSAENGQQVGSFKISNITAVGTTTTARATAFFTSSVVVVGGTKLALDSAADAPELAAVLAGGTSSGGTDGDPSTLTPPFANGMKVQIFDLSSNKVAEGAVVEAAETYVVIDVPVSIQVGSIAQTAAVWEGDKNLQNLYTPGVDYLYSPDSGQIIYYKMPAGFPIQNTPLVGSEVVEAQISFQNASMKPARIPALDGKEVNDSGRLQVPRVRAACELRYLLDELSRLRVGSAKHLAAGPFITLVALSGPPIQVGDSIQFIDGPNDGFSCTVSSVAVGGFNVSPAPAWIDTSGSNFVVGTAVQLESVLNSEIATMSAELALLDAAVLDFGTVQISGSGSASGSTWTAAQDLSGTEGKLLWVTSGASRGLWKIQSASGNTATVSAESYPPLVTGSGSYSIVDPWPFLQEVEFQFVAGFYRSTLGFLQSTQTWAASVSADGADERRLAISQRQSDLAATAGADGSLPSLLRDGDNLYDTRYLWIDQRTNRESGLLQMQARSAAQALEIITKVTENQRKTLLLDAMAQL